MIGHRDLALLESRAKPFSSPGWIYELKYDGYRCLGRRGLETAQMLSRNGRDMAPAFPELTRELMDLPPLSAIDGELVMLDERGHPQFDRLLGRAAVSRSGSVERAARERPATIVAWDVLVLAGKDLRELPLVKRKQALKRALRGMQRIQFAEHETSDGHGMYAMAVRHELEGIVAKRSLSPYSAGRTTNWIKIKTPIGREREVERMEHRARKPAGSGLQEDASPAE